MEFEERYSCIRHIRGYGEDIKCSHCDLQLPSRSCRHRHVEKLHNPSSSDQGEVRKRRLINWMEEKDPPSDQESQECRVKWFGQYG